MTATPYTVWMACPCPGDSAALEPWEPVRGHITHPLILPTDAAAAHDLARGLRRCFPGDLVAVRPADAGPPLHPEDMADHYDRPPYI